MSVSSIRRNQGLSSAKGMETSGTFSAITSIWPRDMISRLARRSPTALRSRSSRVSAVSISGSATMASALVRGRGNSFSAAAVMMPSVPSAPMKSCFRS